MRLLRYSDLKPLKGLPYSQRHVRRLVKAKKFPEPIKLSDRAGNPHVAWAEPEIDDHISKLVARRGTKSAA